MAALYKQIKTKFEKGQISTVKPATAVKMLTGKAAETALVPGSAVGAAASKQLSQQPPQVEHEQKCSQKSERANNTC